MDMLNVVYDDVLNVRQNVRWKLLSCRQHWCGEGEYLASPTRRLQASVSTPI
jgi:hypothetical protein